MAHFRATIKGNRGEASRLGHKEISASINGWDVGVRVYGSTGHGHGDIFSVYATGGSNASTQSYLIATIYQTENGLKVEPAQS